MKVLSGSCCLLLLLALASAGEEEGGGLSRNGKTKEGKGKLL